jgi:dihydropteroate synthase
MPRRKFFRIQLPFRALELGRRTLVMGVLNITPDSFSDSGLYADPAAAVARAFEMEHEGADILDVGAESTRPGAIPVEPAEQLHRILPVLERLRGRLKIPVSVDTSSSEVAEASAILGAEILNNVTALRGDSRLAEIVRRRKLGLILMHMRGSPRTMQKKPFARDTIRDVSGSLRRAVAVAREAGIKKSQIILDPGIGFGKTYAQDYDLLARLRELVRLGFPLLVGTSRKKFIGRVLGTIPPRERVFGTAATVAAAILNGAHIVRVHDVAEMVDVARVADAVLSPRSVATLPKPG